MRRSQKLAIVGIVVVAVIAALFLVPVPQPFSATVLSAQTRPGGGSPGVVILSFLTGAAVKGTFSTGDLSPMGFEIIDDGGQVIFQKTAVSAPFSFTASDPPYSFVADSFIGEPVTVSGTATAPLL